VARFATVTLIRRVRLSADHTGGSPEQNFAEEDGCGLYDACSRVSEQVQPRAPTDLSPSATPLESDLDEALGTEGYTAGLDTFNVLDSIG
jgi:hypothetical protein